MIISALYYKYIMYVWYIIVNYGVCIYIYIYGLVIWNIFYVPQ